MNNMLKLKPLFGHALPRKFLAASFLSFLHNTGVIGLLSSSGNFTFESVKSMLRQELDFHSSDSVRARMIEIIIDFLYECQLLEKTGDSYVWRDSSNFEVSLTNEDMDQVQTDFGGQVNFFEKCINYAEEFLKGGTPLFGFNQKSLQDWGAFLGNSEYEMARLLLMKLILSGKGDNCAVLNLCYGLGYDIMAIQRVIPDAKITAIDFTNAFHESALDRIVDHKSVRFIDSSIWRGFGCPLPFDDQSFDLVCFNCADPYISRELKDFVYRDIFRILKSNGSLGILTSSYPDHDKNHVKDPWIRKGILCHDFAESVCEGWGGFSEANNSIRIFEEIGFDISSVTFNSSLWRLDKP